MAKRKRSDGHSAGWSAYQLKAQAANNKWLQQHPSLKAYLSKVGATLVSIRKAEVIEDTEDRYRRVADTIRFKDGHLTWSCDVLAVDDAEKAAIEAELSGDAKLQSVGIKTIDTAPFRNANPDALFIYRNAEGDIIFVQQRIFRENGIKDSDLAWSYWSDGIWRMMEPDGLLPLFGLDQKLSQRATILIHEGAKCAKYCQWLAEGKTVEAREAFAALPEDWAFLIEHSAHIGWPGGAPNSHKVDWSPLRRLSAQLILVLDNDDGGKDAAPKIANALGRQLDAIRFDNHFPPGFDLGDPFPEADNLTGEPWWEDRGGGRRWRGPRRDNHIFPATWATRQLPSEGGRPPFALTQDFKRQWYFAVTPAVFVHRDMVQVQLVEDEFNARVRPFADVENVARLLRAQSYSSQADGLTYEPGEQSGIVNIDRQRLINVHRPTMVRPIKGDPGPWIDFINYLVPVENECWHLQRWCATLIAKADRRMEFSCLVVSEMQGVGKTTLGESILAPLVGWWNTSVPSETDVVEGSFNSWLAKVRLIIIHEIYAGQSKRAYDQLKSVVTEKKVTINEKFVKPYILPNRACVFASSNSLHALYMDDEDRRWLVVHATEERRPESYWQGFYDWLKGDGLGVIYQWAIDFVAKDGAVGPGEHAPETVAKSGMIEESRSEGKGLAFHLGEQIAALGDWRPKLVLRTTQPDEDMALLLTAERQPLDLSSLKRGITYSMSIEVVPPIKIALVIDSDLREWIAVQRGFTKFDKSNGQNVADLNAKNLERPLTLRKMLTKAGLKLPARKPDAKRESRYMIDGRAQTVVFNFEVGAHETWDSLKVNRHTPDEIIDLWETESEAPPVEPPETEIKRRSKAPFRRDGARPGSGRKRVKEGAGPM